jgi:hypothetical protein
MYDHLQLLTATQRMTDNQRATERARLVSETRPPCRDPHDGQPIATVRARLLRLVARLAS